MKHITTILAALTLSLITAGTALANQINPVTGAYYTTETDLKVAARGIPMAWERTYRSNRTLYKIDSPDDKSYDYAAPVNGPLGFGWHSPFTMHIWKNAPIVSDPAYLCDALVDADGSIIYFEKGPGGIVLPDYASGYTLSGGNGGNYTLTKRGGNTWTFDSDGRLLTIADPLGRTSRLVYSGNYLSGIIDAAGRTVFTLTWSGNHIIKVTDLGGRTITYSYDASGNLASVNHDSDTLFSYGYNVDHGLVTNTNSRNETWRVTYRYPTNDGLAMGLTAPDGGASNYAYDFATNSTSIKDPSGASRTQVRDNSGHILSERENGVANLTVAYLGGGLRQLTDAQGNTIKEYRDQWDKLTKRIDPEGNITQYSYNSQGKPNSITDPEGNVTEISYDSSATLPIQITRAKGTADQVVIQFSYTGDGDLKETTTGGSSTSITYNQAGLPVTITDPEGGTTTLEYDAIGNLISSTDANQNKSEYTHDWQGKLLTDKDGEGNITTYTYTVAGQLASITDPKNNLTTITSDHAGRITSRNDPNGITSFTYDKAGNLATVTRGDATTSYTYDTKNRVVSTTDPEGNTTSYSYNPGGSCSSCGSSPTNTTPTSVTDPLGNTTLNTLDKLGRIKQITDPLTNITSLFYDKAGRITTKTDANGNTTTYSYDALGRVKSQADAEGGITRFTYDSSSNLISLTDPANNTTQFEYDKVDRKIRETRPEGQATTYSYYPNGLLKTVTDAKQQTTTYIYDKANRLIETRFNDNTKHTFQYDKDDNLTNYATPDVSGTITYDNVNRKTGETVTIGSITKTYSYSYDGRGNKQSFTSPEGVTYSYSYNKNDQPTAITTPAGQIKLDYQWARNTKVTLPNGVTTDFSYNANNWLTGITAQKAAASILSTTYVFDKVGNITQKADDVTTSYNYDKIYQLLSTTNPQNSETFGYDKVGNRKTRQGTQTPWTYNKNNELQTAETATFTYDNNGNTITKTENGVTTTFNYNTLDRLASVQLPDGRTAAYTYDPFGRRIKKQVGTETTVYVYADEGLIGEYTETGTSKKTYGWHPDGVWGTNPIFQTEKSQYYFYHNDHLGTPQTLTDANGDFVWGATYEAFGKATVDSDSTIANNLRFPGQYFDEETGLSYNYIRNYDQTTGRYIKADPIGLEGGINLFAYVQNNPNILIDPYGLSGTLAERLIYAVPEIVEGGFSLAKYLNPVTAGVAVFGWAMRPVGVNDEPDLSTLILRHNPIDSDREHAILALNPADFGNPWDDKGEREKKCRELLDALNDITASMKWRKKDIIESDKAFGRLANAKSRKTHEAFIKRLKKKYDLLDRVYKNLCKCLS